MMVSFIAVWLLSTGAFSQGLEALRGTAYWQPPPGSWKYYDLGSRVEGKPWGAGYAVNLGELWIFGRDLWATTYGEGIIRMDTDDGSWEIYREVDVGGRKIELLSLDRRIAADFRGHIWMSGSMNISMAGQEVPTTYPVEYQGERWALHEDFSEQEEGWRKSFFPKTPVAGPGGRSIWFAGEAETTFVVLADTLLHRYERRHKKEYWLWRYDVGRKRWDMYPMDFDVVRIFDLYVDSRGTLWMLVREDEGVRIRRGIPQGDKSIQWTIWSLTSEGEGGSALFQELLGKLWLSVALNDGATGLWVFEGDKWHRVSDVPVGRLVRDLHGNIWAVAEGVRELWSNSAESPHYLVHTLAMFDGQRWYYFNNHNPPEDLADVPVLAQRRLFFMPDSHGRYIATDSLGAVWIAAYGGVVRWEPPSRPFVEEIEARPSGYELYPVYPNPFNSIVNILFSLGVSGDVRIGVYDVLGREVRVLVEGRVGEGVHRVFWDGRDDDGFELASGVYLVRIEAENFRKVRKVVLAR